MSTTRVTLLAVTVIGPDLPLSDHSGRCGVCFCGRPLPLVTPQCEVCGYVLPRYRRARGESAETPDLLAQIEASIEAARRR